MKEFKNSNGNFLVATSLLNTVWNKTYKREFLVKNNILFSQDFKAGEDGVFNILCIFHNPKIIIIDELLYNYRIFREGGVTSILDVLEMDINAFKYIINLPLFQEQPFNIKQITIQKYICNIIFWYKHNKQGDKSERFKNLLIVEQLLASQIDSKILSGCTSYLEFKDLLQPKKFIDKVFSIKDCYVNMKKRKILTILGIKLKLKG